MQALVVSRRILTILVIVSSFSLGEGQVFNTVVDASKKILKTTKVKTTVTKNKIEVDDAAYKETVAEAGTAKSSSSFSSNIALNLKGTYNSCGCGGDRCVKYGKCRISGYNPVCCNNKCMCVQATVEEIADKLDATCGLCTVDQASLKLTCREASIIEFNCWTNYKEEEKASAKVTYQYAYF